MNKLIVFCLLFLFVSCREQKTPEGFFSKTINFDVDSTRIDFFLDKTYDTLYQWQTSGCTKWETKFVYQFQNKKTLMLYARFCFDTLTESDKKNYELRYFGIAITKYQERFSQKQIDTIIQKLNKRRLRNEKELNPTFIGFDYDTVIYSKGNYFAIIKKHSGPWIRNKITQTISATTFYKNREINILFENTEDADSVWFANSLETIKSIHFRQN